MSAITQVGVKSGEYEEMGNLLVEIASGEKRTYSIEVECESGLIDYIQMDFGGCPMCRDDRNHKMSMTPDGFSGEYTRICMCYCGTVWMEQCKLNGEMLQVILTQVS